VLGVLIGIVVGVLVAQNFYDYRSATGVEYRTWVNEQQWEPIPNTDHPVLRRPRFRLG